MILYSFFNLSCIILCNLTLSLVIFSSVFFSTIMYYNVSYYLFFGVQNNNKLIMFCYKKNIKIFNKHAIWFVSFFFSNSIGFKLNFNYITTCMPAWTYETCIICCMNLHLPQNQKKNRKNKGKENLILSLKTVGVWGKIWNLLQFVNDFCYKLQ